MDISKEKEVFFSLQQNKEVNLICIFASENRNEIIEDLKKTLTYLDDPDMEELSHRTIEKLQNMTDEEFEQLKMIEAK